MCINCRDTGRKHLATTSAGVRIHSDYLDCVQCSAAEVAAALGVWLAAHPNAAPLEIFQHGRDVERTSRAAADSLPKIKEGATPKPDAWKYRAIGNGEWRVTLNEDWARALNDPNVVPLFAGAAPASQAAAPADNLAPGLDRAARYLEKQADDYLHDFSSTEHDTGATSFHFGEAGREHHALLGELAEEIRALAGAAPVEAANQWQPIETAPLDGSYVLLGSAEAGGAWVGKFEERYQSGWRPENPWSSMMLNVAHLPVRYPKLRPTHWMPLPAAPAPEAQ